MKESVRQKQRGQQLEEELRIREQELENTLTKQREVCARIALMLFLNSLSFMRESTGPVLVLSKLGTRIQQLSCEHADIKEQNQQLRRLNIQLQEQVESSREQLQAALGQLSLLQLNAAQEQVARQR